MHTTEQYVDMDNGPEIIFDWKNFSELSTKQKLSVLNYYAGAMKMFWLLTRWEREKVYQRFVKEFHKSE